MSDVQAVKGVISKIESLQRQVTEAQRAVKDIEDVSVRIVISGRSDISRELRPALVNGLKEQIQAWELEIHNLEKRVVLR